MNAINMAILVSMIIKRSKPQSISDVVATYVSYTWIPLLGALFHLTWFKEDQMHRIVARFEKVLTHIPTVSYKVSPIPIWKVVMENTVSNTCRNYLF